MEAGIVGLPNVGKSTLFNAFTNAGADAANYPFCTVDPNAGVVAVPDARLETLNKHVRKENVIPAVLKVVDIAGLVSGASKGEGLGNRFLSHIREVDAILHVVRCFDDPNVAHTDATLDPVRDIEIVETELLLADLESTESALDKAHDRVKRKDPQAAVEVHVLEQCRRGLREGIPVRAIPFSDPEETKMLKSLCLLTAKKVLYVANVSEDDLPGNSDHAQAVRNYAKSQDSEAVFVSAELDAEIRELDAEDRKEMLVSLGIEQPALDTVIKAAYKLLGLISFFTVGKDQVRAWTIPAGTKAPQAAGTIHTDFERGFIRAEVYRVEDLETYGSEADVRAAGKLRTEGKDYVVKDGDVCYFLFSV